MLKRLRLMLIPVVVLLSLAPASLAMASCDVPADTTEAIKCGANNTAGVPQNSDAGGSIDSTIGKVVNLISVAVGIAAVIMIIIAGFRYVTSAGNPERTKGAKNTLLYALIGLVIVALAQIIVQFVLKETTQPPSCPTGTTPPNCTPAGSSGSSGNGSGNNNGGNTTVTPQGGGHATQ